MTQFQIENVLASKQNRHELIHIPIQSNAYECLLLLKSHHILSVAVTGTFGHWLGVGESQVLLKNTHTQFLGLVGILDLVTALFEFRGSPSTHLKDVKIVDIIGKSLESLSLWVLPVDSDLRTLAEVFSKGVHRILVAMDPGTTRNDLGVLQSSEFQVCTQMDLIRFLVTKEEFQDTLMGLNVSDMACQKTVKSVKLTDTMRQVIQDMYTHGLQAIPVLSEEGELLGTLSLSDLKHFLSLHDDDFMEMISRLSLLTVKEFMPRVKGMEWMSTLKGTCFPQDHLKSVMERMVSDHYHRLWILGHEKNPVGVVSLTDIIQVLIPYLNKL